MGSPDNTKEYIMPEDNAIFDVSEQEFKEDLTSFTQDVIPSEEPKVTGGSDSKIQPPCSKWRNLTKKQKIKIGVGVGVGLIVAGVIIGIIIYYFKLKPKPKPKPKPNVVITKDNYQYQNGKLLIYNEMGQELGSYECQNKDPKKCYLGYQNNETHLDGEKHIYQEKQKVLFEIPVLLNRYVFIYDGNSDEEGLFLYDFEEQKRIATYQKVRGFNEDNQAYFSAQEKGKYGFFKIEASQIIQLIDFKYDYLDFTEEEFSKYGYLTARKGDDYYLIDYHGEPVSSQIGYEIKGFNQDYIIVASTPQSYNLVDYHNNKILKNDYVYLRLLSQFVIAIDDRNELKVLNYEGEILPHEKIKLTNRYYNKTYIYNKNNQLLNTKEAFTINETDGVLNIEYGQESVTPKTVKLNVYESMVSNNYPSISYFSGYLYFYADKTKTDLLGKYKCQNKNVIDSEDSTYDNCYLAKESNFSTHERSNPSEKLGYLPIINRRYVFINDTIDSTTTNIILYDLTTKKQLGVYHAVDLGRYDGQTELSLINKNRILMLGQSSRNNQYFPIEISSNKEPVLLQLGSKKDSSFRRLERLGEYIIAQRPSGTYQLFDQTGRVKTEEFGVPIVNYVSNYVKLKGTNGYSVCSFRGDEIVPQHDFIDLKDSYCVAITGKYLHIYEYRDPMVEVGSGLPLKVGDVEYVYVGVNKPSDRYEIILEASDGSRITKNLS